jgi:hypothetical protein
VAVRLEVLARVVHFVNETEQLNALPELPICNEVGRDELDGRVRSPLLADGRG